VHPRDLVKQPSILYVGVGGGMELLQFSYFSRRPGAVIGLDVVDEMLTACRTNLDEAQAGNAWFRPDFVELRRGDTLALPIDSASIDVAAQNCLFNIFHDSDLILSDPVCDQAMPPALQNDERLRALCLSGAIPLAQYIRRLTDAGFGTIEVRAKRPYRVLSPNHYATDRLIHIDSVEICAIKDPMPADGPCVFTGRSAIYFGNEILFDDGKGHAMTPNQPLAVCDKTAAALLTLGRDDLYVSPPTWFYDGGGCC
jgi:uncharacterized protein YfiM (DUF2279 family)